MDEAQDVVQDVFVKILLRQKKDKILNLDSYIRIAVRNSSLRKIQRSQKLQKFYDNTSVTLPSYEEQLIALENDSKVRKAIEALPEQTKKALKFCVMDGLSYENAADSMEISVNTVKYHLKKAYKELRLKLRDTYFSQLIIIIFSIF
jgi:RNA polymerase sigma-70 factor (ECF subfamily)